MTGHLALVVDQPGAVLEAGSHDTVVVRHADGRRERVGLRALGSVVLHGDVTVSTGLLRALVSHNVALSVLSGRGRGQSAGFTQVPHRQADLRHRQHCAYADRATRLTLARMVVHSKLNAMAVFAREHAPSDAEALYRAMHAATLAEDNAALMGVEGAATSRHFQVMERAYGKNGPFTFVGRTRRPPADAPNALMSLCYTLAQAQAVQLALRFGLDVQLGFLHGLHRDRQSLALDLIEPARAAMDDWILDVLMRRRALSPKMFSTSGEGGAWLTKKGRGLFYPLWFREGYRVALAPMRSLLASLVSRLRSQPFAT